MLCNYELNIIPVTGLKLSKELTIYNIELTIYNIEADIFKAFTGTNEDNYQILFSCHTNNGLPYANIISYFEHVDGHDKRCYAASRYKRKFHSEVNFVARKLLEGGYCWDYERQIPSTEAMVEYQKRQYEAMQTINQRRITENKPIIYDVAYKVYVNNIPYINVHY